MDLRLSSFKSNFESLPKLGLSCWISGCCSSALDFKKSIGKVALVICFSHSEFKGPVEEFDNLVFVAQGGWSRTWCYLPGFIQFWIKVDYFLEFWSIKACLFQSTFASALRFAFGFRGTGRASSQTLRPFSICIFRRTFYFRIVYI